MSHVNGIKYALLSKFAIHYNFILIIAHIIKFFVPELAFTTRSYQTLLRFLVSNPKNLSSNRFLCVIYFLVPYKFVIMFIKIFKTVI
jgi:hypothetical protein